ncbi:MAG: exo-alpha-sialidase [Deltaproteobacteria bacterium]|nr:exo-alpha-sialidase [Deltaproteobacteria bacterium]
MKITNYELRITKAIFAAVLLLASYADCQGGDGSFAVPFGISHPDKKVSPPAVAAYDGKIFISYIREEGDVYITTLSADGKTLIAPVKVNDAASPANGIHQSPGLTVGTKGEIYVTWTSPREGGEFAADIRFTFSTDGGKTFSPSVAVNDNTTPSSRGFESIATGKNGTVFVAWLDGREKKPGVSSAYFASSADGGKTFEKNIKLDGNACPCCRTAITSGANGAVYVSWRKVFEGDMRDMAVAGSADNGKTFKEPVVVSQDRWAIQGCPHRGPSMDIDEKGILYYTWYTEGSDGLPSIYLSASKDGGKTFSARQILPIGERIFPDHPRLTVEKNGTVYLVWEEKTPVLSKIMFASYREGKGFSKPEQLSQGVRRSYEPLILAGDDGTVYAAWGYDEIRFSKALIRTMK